MTDRVIVGNSRYLLGERIGKGGEGEVFSLKGNANLAAKIYSAKLRTKRENKVRAMVREGLAGQTNLVAYPRELVSDRRGNFLGFVMQLLSGYRPIHELYSPKSRQHHFPKADYRFVIRVALNTARAVDEVHKTGGVIGDLNHSGVLVSQDATIAMIDADSFQFQLSGKTYPCVVGVPDFTPPELHGVNLARVERRISHDNFALAVAIFHFLFMGRHPYAGRYNGPPISIGEAIAQNRFAYSLMRHAATQTSPPPHALTLDLFPRAVGEAFEKAFGLNPSRRPSAADWVGALIQLEGSLSRCSRVKTHYYPSDTKTCVWCDLARKNSFDMFPDLSPDESAILTNAPAIERAIREILAFRFPSVADVLPQAMTSVSGGSSTLREAQRGKSRQAFVGLLMMAGAIATLIYATSFWLVWLALGGWGWAIFTDREVDAHPFRKAFEKADEQIQREFDAIIRRNGLTEVMKVRSDLDVAIASYKHIDDELAREEMKRKSTREARQRNAYLDQFSIRRAKISGIGPVKTITLISFGIETAADINRSKILQIPGFGDAMTGNLMDWRRSHECRFRYKPTQNAQDVADERGLRAKYASQKTKFEATIRNGLNTLRTLKPQLDALPAKARCDRALSRAFEVWEQAERDLRLLGVSVPYSTVFPKRASPNPSQKVGQALALQQKASSAGKWLLSVVGIGILIAIVNVGQDNNSKPSSHRSYPPSNSPSTYTPSTNYAPSTTFAPSRSDSPFVVMPPKVRSPSRHPTTQVAPPRGGSSRIGRSGESVRATPLVSEIQSLLARLGYDPGPIDGILGIKTRKAIESFQLGFNIRRDGKVTSELVRQLRDLTASRKIVVHRRNPASAEPKTPRDTSSRSHKKKYSWEEQVRLVQYFLNRKGYFPGKINGVYGAETKEAIARFQLSLGIPPDGQVSSELIDQLTGNKTRN